jgi:hypothetical protein
MLSDLKQGLYPKSSDNACIRPLNSSNARSRYQDGIDPTLLRKHTLATSRSKRWNGSFDSLPVAYLKSVLEKMSSYGDRVQFSLISGGSQPSYQITNPLGKEMAFDGSHHLLHPENEEFVGSNATAVYTLDQVKAAVAGVRSSAAPRPVRVTRASSGSTPTRAAKLDEQFASQRYEYFRNNRQSLPPEISNHSNEIVELMKAGKPVEEAFGEVVTKYFKTRPATRPF